MTIEETGTVEAAIPRQRDHRRRLVVVGNGMAGIRAVEELLERGGAEQFDITVFGDEPYGNYNRILLSHVLSGEETEEGIFLNSLSWYEENSIDLRAGVRVDRVDRFAKVVHDADGGQTPYDTLLLATGSTPFFPSMDGLHLDGVFTFRTLDDARSLLASARTHRRAVVIGGGLLGLEAAHGLATHGLQVDLVHSPQHLMNQQLGPEAGRVLRRKIEELGIRVHTGVRTRALLGTDRVSGVELPDGTVLEADFVVIAAGIRPNVDVALRSGLAVERGVVVDDRLRTSHPDVYAVGECVQHRGQTYGLVAPLWDQAGVLADHLTGTRPDAQYHGTRTSTKLKVAGVDVVAMGLPGPERDDDEFVVFSEPHRGVYLNVVVRDGRLVGATLLGDVRKTAFLTQAFDQALPLPEERMSLLFDLGAPDEATSVAELSDDVQVCNCNGVTKGKIVDAVAGGCTSLTAVMGKTKAAKGCGSCKSLVEQITEWAAGGELTVDESVNWYVPGVPLAKPELMAAIRERGLKSVSAVFRELAPGGVEDAKSKMGLTSLLRMMWPEGIEEERDGRYINDRVHANIQRDGTFSVVPQMKGGVTTPEQLRKIADVADKYDVGMVKVTGGQRIDLLGVAKEDLPKVWKDLGMPSGYAYGKSFRTVKTCVGSDFCRFGLDDSTQLGIDLETRYQGIETPAKLKLGVVGCPRNCAEAYVKDIGVVAVGAGKWEVYVGGAAGATVRKGDLLATVGSAQEVLTLTGRFIQFYREWGNWLERTYEFVPRLGIERVRNVLVDDSDGLAAGLDERVQATVDNYRDPWLEGAEPVTTGQFRPALPLGMPVVRS
ncbi:nitrite reductase (NADH) large subunit [Kineococcus aurantiacus]|uniref:assimilatory sulfite reductase (ferredoxin) n=1 Tax=Kineococcus aurantiacus TaxID=37633 RepID=A0A7Y9DP33_9ACTN|nr:nitrite reductase (NADH) large subunit [Kineococcus aurantiacus]